MLVAMFGPTTGWMGRTITNDNGVFTLEGHGVIAAADVLAYDREGHLEWAREGMRERVQQTHGLQLATPTDKPVAVGDPYQGGIIAYIFEPGDPGYVPGETHGLIAAEADQSDGIPWARKPYWETSVPGALGTAIGSGAANTDAIIAQNGTGTDYAAGLARAHSGGGYSDWYLPSKDELDKLYLNRAAVGGFESALLESAYWSSSEGKANFAWFRNFGNGHQDDYFKDSTVDGVRAVRAF